MKIYSCAACGTVPETETVFGVGASNPTAERRRLHRFPCYNEITESDVRPSWDQFFMSMAELTASRSKDPSTKVGAVIVDYNRRVIGLGYNGFPRGVEDKVERYAEKQVKYSMIVHAEANAILNCIIKPTDVTLYTTMFPCSNCAKLIIQSGISRVVCPPPREEGVWAEDANFSKQMLREALVFVHGPDHSWQLHNDTTKSGRFL